MHIQRSVAPHPPTKICREEFAEGDVARHPSNPRLDDAMGVDEFPDQKYVSDRESAS
jgi:hypothetical protein